ncbi:hypothetical protein MOX02_59730 [Methylobacterium oxalidis]|uniref:Uncharacterized protein n=1 Tax=Methylobacterium oxalidis TaxID=944322 RepID=A0A512JDC8_9HYPH|nr:hypothetical protein MOX02_59730 [Methylobacterium oxalidis]GJE35298.1 hypothetical protein LDDCCGHA_5516 [Methylobacterium oxalidis]GLS62424.1 hypothetical protein GCM10007888_08050 [Methylobacterium oxalidis]
MTADRRELYASPNGDRWFLARSATTGRPVVLHVPNQPSGGVPIEIELGSFLVVGGGPEHQELLRLIGHSYRRRILRGRACRTITLGSCMMLAAQPQRKS